jgi:hypothetical protein
MHTLRLARHAALALLTPAVLTGCAHYYLPTNQLDTPETIGPDRVGRLELISFQSGPDLIAEPETQSTDPETGKTPDPVLPMSLPNFGFGAWVKVDRDIDVGLRIQPFAPVLARAKYLLYGEPESKSDVGNLTAAVAGQLGLLLGSFEGESVAYYSGQTSLLGGWRFAQRHLLSLAPFLGFANISGVGTSSGSSFRFGAGLGYQYTIEDLFLRAELTWAAGSVSQQSGSVNAGGFFPGAMLGFKL